MLYITIPMALAQQAKQGLAAGDAPFHSLPHAQASTSRQTEALVALAAPWCCGPHPQSRAWRTCDACLPPGTAVAAARSGGMALSATHVSLTCRSAQSCTVWIQKRAREQPQRLATQRWRVAARQLRQHRFPHQHQRPMGSTLLPHTVPATVLPQRSKLLHPVMQQRCQPMRQMSCAPMQLSLRE